MKIHDIDKTFQAREQTELMRKTHQTAVDNTFQAIVQTEALKKLDVDQSHRIGQLEGQLKEFDGRFKNLENGMTLLLKQFNIHPATDHKTTGNPASVI